MISKASGHLSALDVTEKAMPPIHDWVLARITDNWNKLAAVATALLEKKTLSHDEVSQIIESIS
jgi:hypothetical protein